MQGSGVGDVSGKYGDLERNKQKGEAQGREKAEKRREDVMIRPRSVPPSRPLEGVHPRPEEYQRD